MSAEPRRFRLGVNYLPPGAGMAWLRPYDPALTRRHFRRAAAAGFDSVRVFLPWEDAQPAAGTIDPTVLADLVDVANAAGEAGVELIVTLFTGHMSGVNWIPAWATGAGWGTSGRGTSGDRRFRVVSGGRVQPDESGLRNWYTDPEVTAAQERLAGAAAGALGGHPAIWAWDLGNENSNCTVPPDRLAGEAWLERMTGAIRAADPGRPITIGTHMEDLEEDRGIGPAEAARHCDFVCMHGYPIYAGWAQGPTDDHLLPFLAQVTRWLAGGADVLFEEFGLPTAPDTLTPEPPLVSEAAAAAYTARSLDALREAGCTGALLWCFSDYDEALYRLPPLDLATHERSFGLWRAGGSPKPALDEVARRVGTEVLAPPAAGWIDIDPEEFRSSPRDQLIRLYRRSRETW
ncbi:MAG TPA: cellulase family glycosylhydrolase [Actinomycetota bacterium]